MISCQDIQDNLYSLYGDLAVSGLVDSGTAGGCRYIRHVASAWPNMVYPGGTGSGEGSAGGTGSGKGLVGGPVDIAALVEAVKAGNCPRLVLLEGRMVTEDVVKEMNTFRFLPAAQWINMMTALDGEERHGSGKLECRTVDARNPEEWKNWSNVAENVLFKKEKLAADLFRYGCEKGLFTLLTGYSGGQPVSTALLYTGRLAGVYMVATLPSFQGKGLASELMRFTGSVAAAAGYSDLVLHSTKPGVRLYEGLGYQPKGELLLYYCMA
jgi:GNAT superfamily N-acetyltransferase